ncbi:carboxymuconolactone decarboxylase family protein [Microbacterium sp. KSW4-11]|uniref:Carboxymuconolactone decarboxylase family protein n=1 Tax=Microbacterium gawkjiense TaxID=3067309 RepID=A0ABU3G765_9MICO|nr:carboxymuconolactone decarboxylase family protein [Microbacterium sp. KSW4-11]MDT3315667.1 carboxymuconolactone decarboxylase family protein [Microbacterium sp. KSW4-11]
MSGWTGGADAIGDIAPALAHYTDKILFDEVWERSELSKRDRSLVTVTALVTLGATEQLTFHASFARDNGVTETELVEAITHLAFYVGWPRAMAAIGVVRAVFAHS